MLCRLFMIVNTWDISLPIHQEYWLLSWKTKNRFVFSRISLPHVVWALPSCLSRIRLCVIGWTIPGDRYNHSTAPKYGILGVNMHHFFYTILMPICYVGCLMIINTWTYISLYRNTAIFENKISVCIFPFQLVNTCDLHLFRLLKCAICSTISVKMLPIGQFEKFFKFQSKCFENLFMVIYSGHE